ncbi:MAG: flippase-like domain-containing protein [Nocardioides sp.]|nr:flippase-like domain-containing protein [Nocardioides sp.]
MTLDTATEATATYAEPPRQATGNDRARPRGRTWLRFIVSWALALTLLGLGLPRAVDVSWHVVLPALQSLQWTAAVALVAVWFLSLYVHSFLLTAAGPGLTRSRAITLNVTGSAVANVVPLGGAVGLELNRRMMKAWGIDARTFSGYVLLINLWSFAAKLLLPATAVLALGLADEAVGLPLRAAAVASAICFVGLAAVTATVLSSSRGALAFGHAVDRTARVCMRRMHRECSPHLVDTILDIRRECLRLIATGWPRMAAGIGGYVALQYLLLGLCLHLAGAGNTWPEVLAGFAVERTITLMPITPGGIGVADLGLVGVLIAMGGAPAGVAAAAVLYRAFIVAVQIPVGGFVLGLWLLHRRLSSRPDRQATPAAPEPG